MKLFPAGAALTLCLVLAAHNPSVIAAEPEPGMRQALEQMVAAQDLESEFPGAQDQERADGTEIITRAGAQMIAAHPEWNEAQQARAQRILAELAPQVAARVRAERSALLKRIGPDMIRETYPKYLSAAEISQLAAYYASAPYKKMRPIMSRVEREAASSGADRLLLWRQYAAEDMEPEELQVLREFQRSELGQKVGRIIPRLFSDWGEYWRGRVQEVIAAATIGYREEFARRMAMDENPSPAVK